MLTRFLYDRLYLAQRRQCGGRYIQIHNPFRLQATEVNTHIAEGRFRDPKTDAVIFSNELEGREQTYRYFNRIKNRQGVLADIFKRIEPHHGKRLLHDLRKFYKFEISMLTALKELCDE